MKLVQRTDVEEAVSLCSLAAGERRFGIDTRRIREVLGRRTVQRVPLAPAYVAGILPYRGEVLTAVSFRAVLGLAAMEGESSLLVLGGKAEQGEGECFALMVDAVCGVVTKAASELMPNASTLDEVSRLLFAGAYRMPQGLLLQLLPERLDPAWLAGSRMFDESKGDAGCAH